MEKESNFVLWYHDTMRYWVRITDYAFKPSHVHPLYLKNENLKVIAMALMNSSLAYWFFNKTTNNKEIQSHVKYLCINPNEFGTRDISQLKKLTDTLHTHYHERYQASEIKTDKALCKSIIDKIDGILAKHYGLTSKELQYIKDFEVGFRIGR